VTSRIDPFLEDDSIETKKVQEKMGSWVYVREWDLVDANVTFIGRLSMVDLQIACLIGLKRALQLRPIEISYNFLNLALQ
jgi:hypothetical protein